MDPTFIKFSGIVGKVKD